MGNVTEAVQSYEQVQGLQSYVGTEVLDLVYDLHQNSLDSAAPSHFRSRKLHT